MFLSLQAPITLTTRILATGAMLWGGGFLQGSGAILKVLAYYVVCLTWKGLQSFTVWLLHWLCWRLAATLACLFASCQVLLRIQYLRAPLQAVAAKLEALALRRAQPHILDVDSYRSWLVCMCDWV